MFCFNFILGSNFQSSVELGNTHISLVKTFFFVAVIGHCNCSKLIIEKSFKSVHNCKDHFCLVLNLYRISETSVFYSH